MPFMIDMFMLNKYDADSDVVLMMGGDAKIGFRWQGWARRI